MSANWEKAEDIFSDFERTQGSLSSVALSVNNRTWLPLSLEVPS
jgi:hypothetical protein